MTQFQFESTGEEVVDVLKDQAKGKIIVITGPSNGGIGGEAALALSRASPRHLIFLSRNISTIQPLIDRIKAEHPLARTTFFDCNLASQESVRKAASEVISLVPHVDILINNAAIPPGPYSKTVDGIESQFGVNHIGHFLLTNLLIPKILAAKPGARIIVVSSSAHRYATTLDNYNFSDGAIYTEWEGYTRSKAANVLFAKSLAEKLEPHGVQAFSAHPGSILNGMQVHVSSEAMAEARRQAAEAAARDGKGVTRAVRKTTQQGCATVLVAALDPSIAAQRGAYLEDGDVSTRGLSDLVESEENARKLWELSEELVGQKFDWALNH